MHPTIDLPAERLRDFCGRWRIRELALFGSALGADFHEESDIDLLVTFASDAQWSLLDQVRMERELADLVGRPVDLLSRQAVERSANPLRRQEILTSAETVYVAR